MTMTFSMVTIDCSDASKLARFWTEALGTEVLQDYGGYVILRPPAAGGVAVGLQQVPEPKQGKNRVHLDMLSDDRAAEAERLVALGATVVGEHVEPSFAWTVLHDPEGNEFCIAQQG
ncbi:MAG TPA: VOC family protein [Pseudonocardiaceae bacterium]